MIVILPPARYGDWLQASAAQSADFLRAWPAEELVALDPPVEERGLF
jgi:putative SOS response-associated peptidase YedK